ncbi:MAG: hypothetical protein WDZ59_01360 [Pirellulales bacterium]
MHLLAQAGFEGSDVDPGLGSILVEKFRANTPEFLISAGIIAALLFTALGIAMYVFRRQTLRHEERIAMIQAGIHPDFPSDAAPNSDITDDTDFELNLTHEHVRS